MLTAREQAESKISAFVADWLDGAEEKWPEGFTIGVVGVVLEVELPPEEQERGYPHSDIGYTCTDAREWVQAGLFRRAMIAAEASMYPGSDGYDEDDD